MEPLDRKDLIDPTVSMEWYVDMKEQLNLRCDYIVRHVAESMGAVVEWWDFNNGPATLEEGYGEFDEIAYERFFGFSGEFRFDGKRVLFRVDGRDNHFPSSWIWMPDDEWQAAAKDLVIMVETSDEAQKLVEQTCRDQHRRQKKALRASITSKLTQEELQYIVFKR